MKVIARFVLVTSLCLVGGIASLVVAAETEVKPKRLELSPDLFVEQISQRVWRHISYVELESWGRVGANGLLVVDGGEAALIDLPWTDEQTLLLAGWIQEELGAHLTVVIPTHSHGDCMGGLAAAHSLGAKSYALELTAAKAREQSLPVPQITFTERHTLRLGEITLELAYHGGAHVSDGIAVWLPEANVLFGGCAVRSASSRALGYIKEADLAQWPATIQSMIAVYPDNALIVPGHGSPGGQRLFERTLELLEEHRRKSGAKPDILPTRDSAVTGRLD